MSFKNSTAPAYKNLITNATAVWHIINTCYTDVSSVNTSYYVFIIIFHKKLLCSEAPWALQQFVTTYLPSEKFQNGGVSRPNEILYPCLIINQVDDAVPLFLAVRRLRQAISALIQQTEKLGKDEKSMKGRITVLIEQPVSSTVDPLAWLHA